MRSVCAWGSRFGRQQLLVDHARLVDEIEARPVRVLPVVEAGDVLVDLGQVPQHLRVVRLLEEERFVDLAAASEGFDGVRAVGEGAVGVGLVVPRLEVRPDPHQALGQRDGLPGVSLCCGIVPVPEEAERESALHQDRLVQGVGSVGVQLQQPLDELLRLPERPAGGLHVADVGLALDALDPGELHVGSGELTEERRVVARVASQGLQVLERALDEVLAERRGAGHRAHLRLDVEDDGVDEPARLVEAPLGETGLPRGHHDPTQRLAVTSRVAATAVRCRRTNLPAR